MYVLLQYPHILFIVHPRLYQKMESNYLPEDTYCVQFVIILYTSNYLLSIIYCKFFLFVYFSSILSAYNDYYFNGYKLLIIITIFRGMHLY